MKPIAFCIFLTLTTINLFASPFEDANEAYQNKDFPRAIELYKESLHNSQSLEQHYNLANAYFENQDYAHAILHYHRALTFSPRNPETLKNLDRANEALNIHPPKPSFIDKFANLFSAYTWSWIYIISLILALLSFLFTLFSSKKLRFQVPFWICIFALIICIGLQFFFYNKSKAGIILTNNAPLRISATSTSPLITELPQGSTIKVLKTKANVPQWSFVKSSKTQEGWLNNDDFKLINQD